MAYLEHNQKVIISQNELRSNQYLQRCFIYDSRPSVYGGQEYMLDYQEANYARQKFAKERITPMKYDTGSLPDYLSITGLDGTCVTGTYMGSNVTFTTAGTGTLSLTSSPGKLENISPKTNKKPKQIRHQYLRKIIKERTK